MGEDLILKARRKWSILNDQLVESHYISHTCIFILFLEQNTVSFSCFSYFFCFSVHQRIGYLAASQSFHEELDILMLTTNMIRKVSR